MNEVPGARALLDQVIPFQFLTPATREMLADRLELRRFAAGEVVMRGGDRSHELYLLALGRVEVIEGPGRPGREIEPGHFFGERSALFDCPRELTIRAMTPVVLYTLPALDFLRLVDRSPTFAQALANRLTLNQGLFNAYRQLWTRILQLVDSGGFLLSSLVPAYRALEPALHPHLHDERLDLGALAYAVARLPEDVTRTGFYYLTLELPPLYQSPDEKFARVRTRARRRQAWTLMPSRTLVLLRDGITDISDLLTCLCAYAVEARKIRLRASSSELLSALSALRRGEDAPSEEALEAMSGLDAEELAGLRRIWPSLLWERLHEILLHHEDIALEGEMLPGRYNASAAERWATQVRDAAAEVVDMDQPELTVHLVSSNTHSVGNCLSAYIARRREAILSWGRAHHPELSGRWSNETDLLYTVARRYIASVDGAREACVAEERASGHYRLSTTAYTGIAVDLICAQRLVPEACDPALRFERPPHPALIVNVDYAFGQQAEEILSNLLFVFGKRVRSVSVLGKAGGLVGQRGDLLLPRATLLQTNDELYPLPNADLEATDLAPLVNDRMVHEGPVLTVSGTLLQDRQMLHFYNRIWKCVGIEMEGSFFARRLISAIETGIVRPDVRSRFAYYVSDVPLNPEANLSEALAPWEGVPPLYAITRAVLQKILDAP